MIIKIILSAMIGHITGCVVADISMGCLSESGLMDAIGATLIGAPIFLFSSFDKYSGGTWAISTSLLALSILVSLSIIGKKKELPWLIYTGIFFMAAILAFWGGRTFIGVARF